MEHTTENNGRLIVAVFGGNRESLDSAPTTTQTGVTMKKTVLVALSIVACAAAHAEGATQTAQIVSIKTVQVDGQAIQLVDTKASGGKVCHEYLKQTTVATDGTVSATKATFCDGDQL